MANTIKHKRGSGSNPGASDLVAGEIAIRTDTGVLFTKKDDDSVVSISGGSTDLGVSTTSSAVTVTSSTGDNATISEASGSAAGVMSTAHHDKLDGIASGAEVNVATNLSKTTTTTTNVIASSTGTNVTLNEATGSAAGLMSTTHHNKLDGIESGATADQSASEILTAIKTVDGASSGLDADLLDGSHASAFALKSGATFTGDLRVDNDADLRIGDGAANERILIQKADNNVSDHIIFYNGTTRVGEIGCEDTSWLRINQETAKNIYTPRYIRSDGGFFVDGTSKGINGSGNFIGGTIAGASDYSTLIRSNTNDNVTGHTEWQDTYQVRLGNSADMKIYHQSGVNYIDVLQDLLIRHGTETMIRCNDDSDVELYHNNSKKLETTSSGVSITGNVAVSGGIDFSADGNAGGATTEVLADYERGTWTPVYRGSSTAGSYSPATAAGVYTKVGNVVYASASVLNIGGSGGSGDLQISGFPFANDAGQSSLGHVFLDDFNMTNTAIYLVAIMSDNETHVTIREVKDTAADTTMSVTDLDGSNSDLVVTITYIAA